MYIAKGYLETKFNKIFKKGDVVPDEIAEHYKNNVEKINEDELLVETPSDVEVIIEEPETIDETIDKTIDVEKPKKKKKTTKK